MRSVGYRQWSGRIRVEREIFRHLWVDTVQIEAWLLQNSFSQASHFKLFKAVAVLCLTCKHSWILFSHSEIACAGWFLDSYLLVGNFNQVN